MTICPVPAGSTGQRRILVIDDSRTTRLLIRTALADDPRVKVIGEAADPFEARELIRQLDPDILTLDIEMPRMNGLTFLYHLMRMRPLPVVMMSSMTRRGSALAVEALVAGAVDCISKSELADARANRSLADRLVAASRTYPQASRGATAPRLPTGPFPWNGKVVLIGASTGGVAALETVLRGLPPDGPPVLIAQHMPAAFLERFAARMATRIPMPVAVAETGSLIRPGQVWLAPGGGVDLVIGAGLRPVCRLHPSCTEGNFSPSVDALFASALPLARRVVAVMLSGMGQDGVTAMLRLRAAGAQTIAQDRKSSAAFGMPGAALALGAAGAAVPLDAIARWILSQTSLVPIRTTEPDLRCRRR